MWAINNTTPYLAEGTWVQDKDANKIWLVVVKATFDVLPDGSIRLAGDQAPVLRIGKPFGEFGKSSLDCEADLLGLKLGTDLLVNGSAWVPRGGRVSTMDIQVAVGSMKKRLRVFGDRFWERNSARAVAISAPHPFESMPIQYERAYGGWDRHAPDPVDHRLDARNPVGTGFVLRSENCIGMRLPNVEYLGQLIGSWKDRPAPAGLNAIDCSWSPRRELAGTYDEGWRQNRFPFWAEDFDPHYNNCAPKDQQPGRFLTGGEPVELLNLSPGGRLAFNLPRIYPVFRTRFGSKRVDHPGQLCTVIIEPDTPRVIMAWQTSLVCNRRIDDLDETVVREATYLNRL